jgi:molybdopterin-guanine dinucleotide biosynthesis protein B
MQPIAVVGTKKSGKTTTIENLTRELTKRGYKVAAIKHINEPDFAFDTPGKDTWRYAQAGAKTVIGVAASETVIVEKTGTSTPSLEKLLNKCAGNDVVLIEGLKKDVSQNKNIPKIAVVKSEAEAENALKIYKPIIAFSGPYNTQSLYPKIPYASALTNLKELSDIVEKILKKHAKKETTLNKSNAQSKTSNKK